MFVKFFINFNFFIMKNLYKCRCIVTNVCLFVWMALLSMISFNVAAQEDDPEWDYFDDFEGLTVTTVSPAPRPHGDQTRRLERDDALVGLTSRGGQGIDPPLIATERDEDEEPVNSYVRYGPSGNAARGGMFHLPSVINFNHELLMEFDMSVNITGGSRAQDIVFLDKEHTSANAPMQNILFMLRVPVGSGSAKLQAALPPGPFALTSGSAGNGIGLIDTQPWNSTDATYTGETEDDITFGT